MSRPCCSIPILPMSLDDLGHNRGVVQRGDVPETVHLPHDYVPENSSHDLSRASLRETFHHLIHRDGKQDEVSVQNLSTSTTHTDPVLLNIYTLRRFTSLMGSSGSVASLKGSTIKCFLSEGDPKRENCELEISERQNIRERERWSGTLSEH